VARVWVTWAAERGGVTGLVGRHHAVTEGQAVTSPVLLTLQTVLLRLLKRPGQSWRWR
jgi:hypothetical protein